MAGAKKQVYITEELDWAEHQLLSWRTYINNNPINRLRDRKDDETGIGAGKVVAKIEDQIKCIRDTMKEYLALLEVVKKLREVEAAKQTAVKGGAGIPARMQNRKEGEAE